MQYFSAMCNLVLCHTEVSQVGTGYRGLSCLADHGAENLKKAQWHDEKDYGFQTNPYQNATARVQLLLIGFFRSVDGCSRHCDAIVIRNE